ncbi:hypothetical protein Xets_02729 [Xenorhabdus sp. TS4]|nr:hypothetical protein [Xenorhabdus sp. TS4]
MSFQLTIKVEHRVNLHCNLVKQTMCAKRTLKSNIQH